MRKIVDRWAIAVIGAPRPRCDWTRHHCGVPALVHVVVLNVAWRQRARLRSTRPSCGLHRRGLRRRRDLRVRRHEKQKAPVPSQRGLQLPKAKGCLGTSDLCVAVIEGDAKVLRGSIVTGSHGQVAGPKNREKINEERWLLFFQQNLGERALQQQFRPTQRASRLQFATFHFTRDQVFSPACSSSFVAKLHKALPSPPLVRDVPNDLSVREERQEANDIRLCVAARDNKSRFPHCRCHRLRTTLGGIVPTHGGLCVPEIEPWMTLPVLHPEFRMSHGAGIHIVFVIPPTNKILTDGGGAARIDAEKSVKTDDKEVKLLQCEEKCQMQAALISVSRHSNALEQRSAA